MGPGSRGVYHRARFARPGGSPGTTKSVVAALARSALLRPLRKGESYLHSAGHFRTGGLNDDLRARRFAAAAGLAAERSRVLNPKFACVCCVFRANFGFKRTRAKLGFLVRFCSEIPLMNLRDGLKGISEHRTSVLGDLQRRPDRGLHHLRADLSDPVLVPSAHALIAVHMKREDRKHAEVVDAIRKHGPPPGYPR